MFICSVFLAAFFISGIIYHCLYEYVWKIQGESPLVLFSRVFIASSVMVLGYFSYEKIGKILNTKIIERHAIFVSVLIVGGCFLLTVLLNMETNLRYGYCSNMILFYLAGFLSVFAILILADKYPCLMVEFFGRNSIIIFALQNILVKVMSKINSLIQCGTVDNFYIISIIACVVFLFLCYFIVIILMNCLPLRYLIKYPSKKNAI